MFGGYQDYFIFFLLIIISKLLYQIINNDGKKNFLEIIFFLSAYILCWMKEEGFFYFVIMVFLLILFEKTRRKKIFFLLSFFILITSYFLLKKFFNNQLVFTSEPILQFLSTTNLSLLIQVLKTITFNVIVAFFKYPLWIIVFITIILSLLDKKNYNQFKYIYTFLIINILFIYSLMTFICLNSGYYSCELISKVSLDRIIFQTSGFYLIFIILFLKELKVIKN